MAPKRIPGAQTAEQAKAIYSTVERTFYTLQLADLNRKINRLSKAASDYEIRNEELQKAYDTLDADRAEVIAYLKKTLNVKNEENAELKDKVNGLEELREFEMANFKRTVNELENKFVKTKAQLTSENKLLAGKLNTLEEFRAIRDDLIEKYERNVRAFEEQEMKYKRTIFDTEKKFILGKDKLKKEMEERLLMLAQEFQDGSELRIAASTHRVIRENIALNNLLDSLLLTQAKVTEQNEKYKEDEKDCRFAMEAAEKERDKAINRSMVQLKVIGQLTAVFDDSKKQKSVYDKKLYDQEKLETKFQKLSKENKNLLLQVRILEQNLHATLGHENKAAVETAKLLSERETFKQILKDSAFAVKASLKMDDWAKLDRSHELMDRTVMLNKILEVISRYRIAAEAQSTDSLVSLTNIYEKGDLGFDVKKGPSRKSLAAAAGRTASVLSVEDLRSAISVSSSEVSLKESIKTVPSVQLIPVDEGSLPSQKPSLPSFTVTSLHSSASSTVVEEEESEMANVSRMLAVSKMEVQKSLMQDLALSNLSRMSHRRISVADAANQKSSMAIIAEKGESTDKIDGEQHETIPGEDNEPTNDEPTKDEPTNDEPTNDEPTNDEPAQDTDETIKQDDEGEKKED